MASCSSRTYSLYLSLYPSTLSLSSDILSRRKPSLTKQDRILSAAFSGDLPLLKKLAKEVDNGVGVAKVLTEVCDSEEKSVLHYAVCGEGKLAMCKYLVEELKLGVNDEDIKGETPLHRSILDGDNVISAYLLDHGADPNMEMDKGFTPLHFAARKGQKDLVRLLISKGAKVDALALVGTPLHSAASHGMKYAVEILLQHNANPNLVCHHALPPLIVAIQAKSFECAMLLLEYRADPNIASCGLTPLIVATLQGHTEMITGLLTIKADPEVTDFYGRRPFEIAAELGNHTDVMALWPETTHIPGIPDSVPGILSYVHSTEAKQKRELEKEEKFLEAKAKGTEAVRVKHYMKAIFWYTEAMTMKPTDETLLSNRSFCWAHLKDGDRALSDALACSILRDDWSKAHYRVGVAHLLLRDYQRAVNAFGTALKLEPKNKEIQEAYREAVSDLQAVLMHQSKGRSFYDEHYEAYAEYMADIM